MNGARSSSSNTWKSPQSRITSNCSPSDVRLRASPTINRTGDPRARSPSLVPDGSRTRQCRSRPLRNLHRPPSERARPFHNQHRADVPRGDPGRSTTNGGCGSPMSHGGVVGSAASNSATRVSHQGALGPRSFSSPGRLVESSAHTECPLWHVVARASTAHDTRLEWS